MLKALLKDVISKAGFRVMRRSDMPLQFDGSDETMQMLRKMGYHPTIIIDGGAHLGAFALQARQHFPEACVHMVEPQKACRNRLVSLATKDPLLIFHQFLLTSADIFYASFLEDEQPSTGARVSSSGNIVEASSLDKLFDNMRGPALLKLDLQGHELAALEGGTKILNNIVDFALIETSLFVEHDEPKTLNIMNFMGDHGFEVFDITAMGRRSRDGRLRQCDLLFAKRNAAIWRDQTWM